MHTCNIGISELIKGKLTKTFLMAAPAGAYMVSNTGWPSIFEESVATSVPERLAQWRRVVAAHANGRNCCLYNSKDESDNDRAWIELAIKARRSN